jgi:hypothetical protein
LVRPRGRAGLTAAARYHPPDTVALIPSAPPTFLQRPAWWFWAILAAGAAVRVFFACATSGTADAYLWASYAQPIAERGVVVHYFENRWFNHPPFIGWLMGENWKLAQALGIEFRIVLRLPVVAFDLVSVDLLARLLRGNPWRWVACAAYAIAPIALVLSGQHGNTDPIVGCLVLAAILLAGARRPVLCGLVIGFSAWIKVPALLAAPAIGFALPRWRDRCVCAGVALALAACTYVPAIVEADAMARAGVQAVRSTGGNVVIERIFAYQGFHVNTGGNPPIFIWGTKNLFLRVLGDNAVHWPIWAVRWVRQSANAALVLMLLLSFLRRRQNDARGLAVTVTGVYALFYGLVDTCTFQYFGWSMPLWMAAGAGFAVSANLLAGGYVYWLYAYVCNDWLLRDGWNLEHKVWSPVLVWLPLVAQVTFLAFGLRWLAGGARDEWRAWRRR